MNPTPKQLEAIESWGRGDVCVVAGPGSGKTLVLVERFRWLVREKKIPVRSILAITFTEKAAANMRRRLVEAFEGSEEREAIERAYISTIHGFCARLLKENAIQAAVDPEFRVLDEWEADFELRRAIEETLEQEYQARAERAREFLSRFGSNDVAGSLFALYQALRAAGVKVEKAAGMGAPVSARRRWQALVDAYEQVASLPATTWNSEQRQCLSEALEIRQRLEALAEKTMGAEHFPGALDFADLEECAIGLLEKSGSRETRDFSFILMDEYQDTNPLQARLVGLLRGKGNFFAVGDINQSIYGFRHADPTVFRKYRAETEQQGGHVVPLYDNFRSRKDVLKAVARIVAAAEGIEPHELDAKKPFPEAPGPFVEVLAVHAEDSEQAMKLEALHLAVRIQELAGEQAGYGDFALLLRTARQVRVFEQVLRGRGIPCEVTAGQGYYEAREVNDLLCFLRVLLNPRDEISLAAVLRSPLVGASDETLLRLKLATASLIEGIEAAPKLPAGEAAKLESFRRLLQQYRHDRDYTPLDRLLGRLLAQTGYEAWLLEQPGGPQLAANVRKFLTLARRFRAAGLASLQDFVDRVEEMRRDEAREAEAEPPEQTSDAVRLMTVHAAKGLEFPVVFLPATNHSVRDSTEGVCFSPHLGVGMRWRNPETGKSEPDAVAVAVAEERRANGREEEQRLFYVGMTRAEERLILSASFGRPPRKEHWAPNLVDNLKIDLKQIDNRARDERLGDCRFRLLQTNQEPAAEIREAPRPAPEVAVDWFDRPAVSDQSDTAVSATAVALFAQCPRKYYLSRYLGFEGGVERSAAVDREEEGDPTAEPDETDPSEFGRHVHGLLAGQIPREHGRPEALALVENFEASAWGRRAAAAARAQREQRFVICLDGRLVSGQIDLWFEEGGETVLIDYKTDQVTEAGANERALDYEIQLRLYALAVERLAGVRPGRAILYFLRPNTGLEISLEEPGLEEARRKVEELFAAQSRLDFPLRVEKHCYHCPHFQGLCPADEQLLLPLAQIAAVE
ncbi:MAG: UvrD-helicase domain-containing protein [Acidobacteria bacterium]|nr:UvrD-helicase domain-containing protein [Acidobacteriota bacterium]